MTAWIRFIFCDLDDEDDLDDDQDQDHDDNDYMRSQRSDKDGN